MGADRRTPLETGVFCLGTEVKRGALREGRRFPTADASGQAIPHALTIIIKKEVLLMIFLLISKPNLYQLCKISLT